MVYHLLPELEQFDPFRGGALAKIVAQWMRADDSIVLTCATAEHTWSYLQGRTVVIPGLKFYATIPRRRFIPQTFMAPLFRRMYAALLARLQPNDVVWCHHQPYIALALAKQIGARGAKLIYHAHDGRARMGPLKKLQAAAWVFGSYALRDRYLKVFPAWKRTYVIYNGADENTFYPRAPEKPPSAPPALLYVGRLQHEKGVHLLVDAAGRLAAEGITVECRVIGAHFAGGASDSSPYIRNLKQSAGPNVRFLGFCTAEQIADELRAAAIFCCPSIWFEAFGMVNVEAMACATPVVAARVGGIPEIGAQGGMVLFAPEAVEELTDILRRLLSQPGLLLQIGSEGRASYEKQFRWSVICERYLEILGEVT